MTRHGTYAPEVIDLTDLSAQARRAADALGGELSVSMPRNASERAAALATVFGAAPELESTWARFVSEVELGGAALVRGFPVESDAMFVLLCSALGEPAPTGSGALIDHVTPRDELPLEAASGSTTRAVLPPHSESSASARPPGALLLGCLINDAVGGDTTLVEVDALVRSMVDTGHAEAVALLADACFPTISVPRKTGDDVIRTAILGRASDGHYTARFRGEQLLEGVRLAPDMADPPHLAALHVFMDFAWNPTYALAVHLQPGEVLGFTNGRLLHGRTAIQADARRDLKRATTLGA